MISRTTFALRRTLPSVYGHHAAAAAAATTTAATVRHHFDAPVAVYRPPSPLRFTPIVPLQVRRGWFNDDDHDDVQPLLRLRWEDVMEHTHHDTHTPPPLASLTEEENEKIVEINLPTVTQQHQPLLTTTTEKPPVVATIQEPPERQIATSEVHQDQEPQPTLKPLSLSYEEAEDAEMDFLKRLLDGISGDGNVRDDMERLQARYPLPSNHRMTLTYQTDQEMIPKSLLLAPRRTRTATWILHKPAYGYLLPEFDDIRSKLSGRSQSRLRLRCRADAATMLKMLERPEEYCDQLAAFLRTIGMKRQRKILVWVPELKPPLLRFIKIVMRRR